MDNMESYANSGVPMRKAIAMGTSSNPKGTKSGSKGTKKSSRPSKKASMQRLSNAGKRGGY